MVAIITLKSISKSALSYVPDIVFLTNFHSFEIFQHYTVSFHDVLFSLPCDINVLLN